MQFLENGWRRKFQDVRLEGTEVIAGSSDFDTQILEENVSFLLGTLSCSLAKRKDFSSYCLAHVAE